MKYATAAVAGAIALVGAALAQTTTTPPTPTAPPPVFPPMATCGAYPAPFTPGFPDGASAKAKDMQGTQDRYKAWRDAQFAAFSCRKAEVERVGATLTPYLARYNAMVDEAKSGAESLRTQDAAWQGEIEKFNARKGAKKK